MLKSDAQKTMVFPRLPASTLMRDRSFYGITITQFLGAFNDNLFKQLMLLLAIPALPGMPDQQQIATIIFAWKWQSKREPARQPKRGPVYGWVTRGGREALVSTLKAYLTVLGGTQGAQNGRFRTYSADGFDRRILAT